MVRYHGNCGSRPLTIVTLWIHDMAIMVYCGLEITQTSDTIGFVRAYA